MIVDIKSPVPSDIDIAQAAKLRPIIEVDCHHPHPSRRRKNGNYHRR